MAIRDDIVASAVQFLQDPSVASSSVENRISFLRSKNLTQEEVDAAMARSGGAPPPPPQAAAPPYPSGPPAGYYQSYPPNAWQAPPPGPPPTRDWRDWFIMATVVGGLGYGLYSVGKRYVMPLVGPPTPERLEQDKKSIEEQFDKAFALVEQLAKDTEELKDAEKERTERLDKALSDMESIMSDLKTANRRREDESQRVRDEVQSLKDAIPKALNVQKELTDNRLREINGELTSLKTLVSQRMTAPPAAPTNPLRPNVTTPTDNTARTPAGTTANGPTATIQSSEDTAATAATASTPEAPKTTPFTRPLGLSNGKAPAKASIPAWQKALQSEAPKKEEDSSSKENQASASTSS